MAQSIGAVLALGFSASAAATNFLQVYHQVQGNDPAYLQAYAIYRTAREARPEAFAVLLPQLTASAGETWDHASGVPSGLGTQSSGARYVYRESGASDTTGQTWSLNPSESLYLLDGLDEPRGRGPPGGRSAGHL